MHLIDFLATPTTQSSVPGSLLGLLFVFVVVALIFDFLNGFHDAANSIATVVSTRVLSPRFAVMWAAFFNFAAFLVFHDEVASTIAKDVVEQDVRIPVEAHLAGPVVGDRELAGRAGIHRRGGVPRRRGDLE